MNFSNLSAAAPSSSHFRNPVPSPRDRQVVLPQWMIRRQSAPFPSSPIPDSLSIAQDDSLHIEQSRLELSPTRSSPSDSPDQSAGIQGCRPASDVKGSRLLELIKGTESPAPDQNTKPADSLSQSTNSDTCPQWYLFYTQSDDIKHLLVPERFSDLMEAAFSNCSSDSTEFELDLQDCESLTEGSEHPYQDLLESFYTFIRSSFPYLQPPLLLPSISLFQRRRMFELFDQDVLHKRDKCGKLFFLKQDVCVNKEGRVMKPGAMTKFLCFWDEYQLNVARYAIISGGMQSGSTNGDSSEASNLLPSDPLSSPRTAGASTTPSTPTQGDTSSGKISTTPPPRNPKVRYRRSKQDAILIESSEDECFVSEPIRTPSGSLDRTNAINDDTLVMASAGTSAVTSSSRTGSGRSSVFSSKSSHERHSSLGGRRALVPFECTGFADDGVVCSSDGTPVDNGPARRRGRSLTRHSLSHHPLLSPLSDPRGLWEDGVKVLLLKHLLSQKNILANLGGISTAIYSEVKKYHFRPILLDGPNVACHRTRTFFDGSDITKAVEYFHKRGASSVKIIVPEWRVEEPEAKQNSNNSQRMKARNIEELRKWDEMRIIVKVPDKIMFNENNSQKIRLYDDNVLWQHQSRQDGVVISNDRFRDLYRDHSDLRGSITTRVVQFGFNNRGEFHVDIHNKGKFLPDLLSDSLLEGDIYENIGSKVVGKLRGRLEDVVFDSDDDDDEFSGQPEGAYSGMSTVMIRDIKKVFQKLAGVRNQYLSEYESGMKFVRRIIAALYLPLEEDSQ